MLKPIRYLAALPNLPNLPGQPSEIKFIYLYYLFIGVCIDTYVIFYQACFQKSKIWS